MARRHLIIEAGDAGQLMLQIEAGTLTLRGGPKHADAVLQPLRVARFYCVLEVEEEPVAIAGPGVSQPLHPGELFESSACRLQLETEEEPAPAAKEQDGAHAGSAAEGESTPHAPAAPPAGADGVSPRRLVVIDGADQGKSFRLPLSGIITLGTSRKHVDIVLHDFYAARLHCQLEMNGEKVVVAHQGGLGGTLVNGQRVARQVLQLGDILRVGNSHLRLELASAGGKDEEVVVRPRGKEAAGEEEGEAFDVLEEGKVGQDGAEPREAALAEARAADEKELKSEDIPEAARQLQQLRNDLERLSGQVLGHFRIGPLLGRGRYGVVFRAEDLKNNRTVALKVLSPLFPQTEAELRHFAVTLKSVLPLRHPNLVGIQGVGKTGMYTWIVRDCVEGESVADLLRRIPAGQRLDWRIGCRVAIQVARALDFARSHHLHHGKVTPANILLRRSNPAALLADLMLTTALEGSHLTQAHFGYRPARELCFLSPEQVQTEHLVDDAADLYTLGAVVYALLTGRAPILGDNAYQILEQVLGSVQIPRPSMFYPAIPAPLEKMVMRLLARNPEDRYPTAAALLADLKHVADKEQVEV